jgi:hypothetical protein
VTERNSTGHGHVHWHICDKCKRVSPVDFQVEPEETWRAVVLNRWRKLCPCFDQLAAQA